MQVILEMYVSLLPVIFAGIFNMIWVKVPYLNFLKIPMDQNKKFDDGKRIFGDNKTWKGFIGMIVFAIISTVIWGLLCNQFHTFYTYNYIYRYHENSILYNTSIGFFLGLAYALLELPNSFLKRRMNISPGKSVKGVKGMFFIFLDQADSIFGCVLVIAIVYPMSISFYFVYVLLGAMTHIVLNMLLYCIKLKRNMF